MKNEQKQEHFLRKSDVAGIIAERTGVTKKVAEQVITEMLEVIKESLAKGTTVELHYFGKIGAVRRESRIARNPTTGETVEVPARFVPHIKWAKAVREATSAREV